MAGRTLTVVKARYSRGLAHGLRLAKGHVRYAVHRSNEQGQRQYREIWDRTATLDKRTAYERLDQTRPADYVYRLTLSPRPEQQDGGKQLDLKAWTRDMMARLERDTEQRAEWFAVTHELQDHRHIHIVAVSPSGVRLVEEAEAHKAPRASTDVCSSSAPLHHGTTCHLDAGVCGKAGLPVAGRTCGTVTEWPRCLLDLAFREQLRDVAVRWYNQTAYVMSAETVAPERRYACCAGGHWADPTLRDALTVQCR